MDGHIISPANCVRQPLSSAEIGLAKAIVMVSQPKSLLEAQLDGHSRVAFGAEQDWRLRCRYWLRGYLTKLREVSFWEIKPGYEDTGAAPDKNTAWSDPPSSNRRPSL
jgi:hypothetical protein